MALTPSAYIALLRYVEQATANGAPHKATITSAVVLTKEQQAELGELLSGFWKRPYVCPAILDLKPQHGYQSRCIKDGYSGDQYAEWVVIGSADIAEVSTDFHGRPNLVVRAVQDHHAVSYDVLVPIRSTSDGHVHIDDVIPRGLKPKQKKVAPSAFP